jgi:hypothetical protein
VIRDDCLDDAKHALEAAYDDAPNRNGEKLYSLCTDPDCMDLMEDRSPHDDWDPRTDLARLHPIPEPNFHTDLWMVVIYLVLQSDHLWWLPPLTMDMPDKNHSYLTLSTDLALPRRHEDEVQDKWSWKRESVGPCGPWFGLYPVRILKPGRFIEALCWLWMRDADMRNLTLWTLWESMLFCMKRRWSKLEGTPGRSVSLWHMERDFRRGFTWLAGDFPDSVRRLSYFGGPHPYQVALLQLRNRLIEQGAFPMKLCAEELPEYELTDEENQRFPWFVQASDEFL